MTVVAVGMLLVATGCGSTKGGTATPSTGAAGTSAATAALWDPCTQISDQVLRKVGVSPSTKRSGIAGVEEPGWKVCSWNNDDFTVGVFSTINTVEDFKRKTDNIDFKDTSVAGRQGVEHRMASDKFDEVCSLVFPASQGVVQILIRNRTSSTNVVAPCTRAETVASNLVPVFPR
ncbi:DUF3558 domain-containing protein [Nocardia pseudovaccinii]|uniref:DUF3558 domain-containing protein n=1 Tax=Nocardia pseudovaccinii TaxID=189540 RepID=UPI0012F4C2D3|nr:DUF3558 domain-containing protein [Nocardia pseudovaccinii]